MYRTEGVSPTIQPIPDFPFAPIDWDRDVAESLAHEENLTLTESHWSVLGALQTYYAQHNQPSINARDLHDALEERFYSQGGMRYLYTLFPKGPIAQGCRLAGLDAPPGSIDLSFGSVQ